MVETRGSRKTGMQTPIAGPAKVASSGKIPVVYRRLLIVAILFFIPAFTANRLAAISDPDIYWHVRAGEYILQTHSMPTADPFSNSHAAWVAYSWLFDLLAAVSFQWADLTGLVALTVGLALLLAFTTWWTIRRLQPDFVTSSLLTAAALVGLAQIYTPRPWIFSICLFAIQLQIILCTRHDGRWRRLMLLPPLYLLVANIHVQFVYSLFVLALAATVCTLDALKWFPKLKSFSQPDHMARVLWATLGACIVSTIVNPYGWNIYREIVKYASARGGFLLVTELQAMNFREPVHYVVLGLAFCACYQLGKQHAKPDVFLIALLMFSTYLGFRTVRDVWLIVLSSSVVLATTSTPRRPVYQRFSPIHIFIAFLMVLFLFAISPKPKDLRPTLSATQASVFPVKGISFIREQGLQGPMFNYFNWGGFIIQYLPEIPVQIDGRGNVHGPEKMLRSASTWDLGPGWQSDPDLVAARLIIAPKNLPLSQHLLTDTRFKLAYKDDLTFVFTRR
jgi:hypothetical protein